MAYQRRRYLPQDDTPHGGGANLVKGILNLLGGGSPTYNGGIDSAASEGGVAMSSGENAPLAKPGSWSGGYNIFDKILGKQNQAEALNNQVRMDQIQTNMENQAALEQAKRMNQQVINPQMQYLNLEKSLAAMPSTGQQGLVDRSISDVSILPSEEQNRVPGTDIIFPQSTATSSFIPPSAKFSTSTTLDPTIALKARTAAVAPQYSQDAALASQNYLTRDINRAQLVGAPEEARQEQLARTNAARAKAGVSGLAADTTAQNYKTSLDIARQQAANEALGETAKTPWVMSKPRLEAEHMQSVNDLNRATAELYRGGRMPLMGAQTKEAEQRAIPEGQKLIERFQALGQLEKGGATPGPTPPAVTTPITAPPMSTAPPVPQAQTVEGTHYRTNPDGTITILAPILLPNNTVLYPGIVKRRQ